jgi:prepilin-type N-terminal cleavage/methylation domain-containing protein
MAMAHIHSTQQLVYSKGFSLLELLLVLFIMGLMTATAMLMTGGVEDQSKYDETKRRMELIKRAIVGDTSRTVNGSPEISGFVADMGRLPDCLLELVESKHCDGSDYDPADLWQLDSDTGLWRGWRGPYLDVQADSDGIKRFRDGFENTDSDLTEYSKNYGWRNFQIIAATSAVQIESWGGDGALGGSGYAADIATSGVVEANDYLTQDTIVINFQNQSATSAVNVNPADWSVFLDDTTTSGVASIAFTIDGAASSVSILQGGNKQAVAKFSSKIKMGHYLLDVNCTSCTSVNNSITNPFQVTVVPRHQIPAFNWNIEPQ